MELQLLGELIRRHRLKSLIPTLEVCLDLAEGRELTVAVFGRFKAGKSTLLNRVIGQEVLPVGALPVTAVITELSYAATACARMRYLDGRTEEVPLGAVSQFVTEAQNPDNIRGAAAVSLGLPSLLPFQGVRLIDTPGLDSAFEHNTRTTREWLPQVEVAIVAVPSDSPMSAGDLALIAELRALTPTVCLALTKYDLLAAYERSEVLGFVAEQLAKRSLSEVAVFPYSARDGFEEMRDRVHRDVILRLAREQRERRAELLAYKRARLVSGCRDYLQVALKAAQSRQAERDVFRSQVAREREALGELRNTLRLLAQDAAGSVRSSLWASLSAHASVIEQKLEAELRERFPQWRRSLAETIAGFSDWLRGAMSRELSRISFRHRLDFLRLLESLEQRLQQAVQDFENRVAARAEALLGMKLRPVEAHIATREPQVRDVAVGKVFDRSWELISWTVPTSVFGGMVEEHLARRLHWETAK